MVYTTFRRSPDAAKQMWDSWGERGAPLRSSAPLPAPLPADAGAAIPYGGLEPPAAAVLLFGALLPGPDRREKVLGTRLKAGMLPQKKILGWPWLLMRS